MMWLTITALALLSRPWEAAAARPVAELYNSREPGNAANWETIHPEAARLIFADRLHLSEKNALGDAPESVLRQFNGYAFSQTMFMEPDPTEQNSHLFAIIDNLNVPIESPSDDFLYDPEAWQFSLSHTPTFSENAELIESLAQQCRDMPGPRTKGNSKAAALGSKFLTGFADAGCDRGHLESHAFLDYDLTMIHVRCGDAKLDPIRAQLGELREAVQYIDKIAATILMVPQSDPAQKRPSNIYGVPGKPSEHHLKRREESILSEAAPSENETTTSDSQVHVLQSSTPSTFPLSPQCWESADACAEATNNCTGHGECRLTAKGPPPSDEDEPSDCYQCVCNKPDVRTNSGGGKKTTYYGGSACHKKDISAPFWILSLTAGSLIALVGFGVSMLYAMGNAELPSVIGAGVSGPRAK